MTRDRFTVRHVFRSCLLSLGIGVLVVVGVGVTLRGEDSPDSKGIKQLRAIYAADAAEYSIYRDTERLEKLELRPEPIYVWTNAVLGQDGSVFVWTWHGRPEAIGSIFSFPAQAKGKRGIMHEFHSVSTATLVPQRASLNLWQPQSGLVLEPLPGAPKPADNARQRLFQLRELSRGFTAKSVDLESRTWELRLLPQPLFRYQSTDLDIIDGALFAFVSSAGTDPEVVVMLEAQRGKDGPVWKYGTCRFSNFNLHVKYNDTEVWSSILGGENTKEHDAKHLYHLHRDRRIDDVEPESK